MKSVNTRNRSDASKRPRRSRKPWRGPRRPCHIPARWRGATAGFTARAEAPREIEALYARWEELDPWTTEAARPCGSHRSQTRAPRPPGRCPAGRVPQGPVSHGMQEFMQVVPWPQAKETAEPRRGSARRRDPQAVRNRGRASSRETAVRCEARGCPEPAARPHRRGTAQASPRAYSPRPARRDRAPRIPAPCVQPATRLAAAARTSGRASRSSPFNWRCSPYPARSGSRGRTA